MTGQGGIVMASKKPVQTDIRSLFSKATPKVQVQVPAAAVAEEKAPSPPRVAAKVPLNPLLSDDPDVRAFYNTLTPNEVIAHSIAVTKLGTSYDVTRTHGFLKWKSARK